MKKFCKLNGKDWFCIFQIVVAWVYSVPQAMQILKSVEGVTINWLLSADIFVLLNLYLSCKVHKRIKRKETLYTLLIYLNWFVIITPIVVITFYKCVWTNVDSMILSTTLALAMSVILVGNQAGKSLMDPTVRGLVVGLFRVVPHLHLAYCIIQAGGGDGVAMITIWAAHVTVISRIISLLIAREKSPLDRGIRSSLRSEYANELSWMIVTITWLLH